MTWFRHAFFLLLITLTSVSAQSAKQPTEITIAIQSFLDKGVAYQQWQQTANYLTQRISNVNFNIVVIDTPDDSLLYQMVDNQTVDYVITQPITTIELNRLYDTNIELTKNDQSGVNQLGSVIFTSSENQAINNIESLKGNSFAASTPERLGGWVLALDYMTDQGVKPYQDFSKIDFLGTQDNIVNAVVGGSMDAGAVRTGVIESMIRQGKVDPVQIKVLADKQNFPYLLSTNLAPEWAFSSLKHTNAALTKKVKRYLLDYKYSDQTNRWVVPLDYESIRVLLRKHRIGSYKDPIYIKYYRDNFVAIIIFLLLAGYLFQFYWNKKKLEVQQYKMRLEQLSRISSVDQLLSEVTHELAQPITSIKIDAHILSKMLTESKSCDFDKVKEASDDLRIKTDHCVDLINNIRNFLSTKAIVKEVFVANKNVEKIINMFKKELIEHDIGLRLSLNSNLGFVNMSPVELDQVLLNLIKNAISAMANNTKENNTLSIGTSMTAEHIIITIADTGGEISNTGHLFALFKSGKAISDTEGLGIGLNLSRRIIRSYGGDLSLGSTSESGSEFIINLPRGTNNEQ